MEQSKYTERGLLSKVSVDQEARAHDTDSDDAVSECFLTTLPEHNSAAKVLCATLRGLRERRVEIRGNYTRRRR